MKLIIKTNNTDIYLLKPRDIRNYIGSIVDEQYKDEVMWHKHSPSKIIYPKPFKQGFEILNYDGSNALMYHIWEKMEENPNITINGFNIKVEKIRQKDEELEIPKSGLFFYKSRTPILLSNNNTEYKTVYAIEKNKNKKDLEKYITLRIQNDLNYRIKQYLGIDMKMEDLSLIFEKIEFALFDYKQGVKKRQGVYITFVSNYSLPRFNGYSIGLGFGEIIPHRK